jgi:hydrogenase expression/formation protein HypD
MITGFEPLDIPEGVLKVVRQLEDGRAEVENQYNRVVKRGAMTPPQIWSKGCS